MTCKEMESKQKAVLSSNAGPVVSPRLFRAIQTVRVDALSRCSDSELRPALASLVRMSLIASLDSSSRCSAGRNAVLQEGYLLYLPKS